MNTSDTFERLKIGFDRDVLPRAFQDAALIAHSLGIKYLWIDTLCIIQDSSRDWEEQAAQMGDIFAAATITIAANSSPNPNHSLFASRQQIYNEIELSSGAVEGSLGVVYKARRKINKGIHAKTGILLEADPLEVRAWALQERILSTRLIAFTGAELQWKCQTLKTCQCRENPAPSQPLFHSRIGDTLLERTLGFSKTWSQIVEEYTTCSLKVQEDKLPAIAGLASKFGVTTKFKYVAGLWQESLLYDLAWQCEEGSYAIRTTTYLGPSFSWVSAPGAISFRLARHSYPGTRLDHTKILDVNYQTTHENTYGRAISASLVLWSHTVTARLRSLSGHHGAYELCIDDAVYQPNANKRASCEFSIDTTILIHYAEKPHKVAKNMLSGIISENTDLELDCTVLLLSLYSVHHRGTLYQNFLIVEKPHGNLHSYRRIGVGTGKIYCKDGVENEMPSDPQEVRPFEWLSVDFALGKVIKWRCPHLPRYQAIAHHSFR